MEKINYIQRIANIVTKAEELGLEIDWDVNGITIDDLRDKAENYIMFNDDDPIYRMCEFNGSGSNQSYTYMDDNDVQHDMYGEIFQFANYKADKGVYLDENLKPVDWFKMPDFDSEEIHNYYFVFDTIVDSNGNLVKLYDRF